MPEDTIHDVAWIMTALCSAFMMLATMTDWYLMKTAAKWFKCGAITVFIVMIIVTFILSIKTTKHK
jgi:hypothetical protein